MGNIKERLLGAITVMSDEEAETIWSFILQRHQIDVWENIEEVVPDEIDLKMLDEAKRDPDCREFVSEKTAKRELGI